MSYLLFSWGVEPLTGGQPERRTLAGSPPQCRSIQWNTCIHIRKHREYKTVFQLHLPASAPWCNFVFLHLFREAVVSPECTFQLTLHQTGLYPVTYVSSPLNTSRDQMKISHALFLSQTYNTDTQTPDSAGTATAMFSGVKTRAGMLGLDGTAAYNVCAPASIQVTQGELRGG